MVEICINVKYSFSASIYIKKSINHPLIQGSTTRRHLQVFVRPIKQYNFYMLTKVKIKKKNSARLATEQVHVVMSARHLTFVRIVPCPSFSIKTHLFDGILDHRGVEEEKGDRKDNVKVTYHFYYYYFYCRQNTNIFFLF